MGEHRGAFRGFVRKLFNRKTEEAPAWTPPVRADEPVPQGRPKWRHRTTHDQTRRVFLRKRARRRIARASRQRNR